SCVKGSTVGRVGEGQRFVPRFFSQKSELIQFRQPESFQKNSLLSLDTKIDSNKKSTKQAHPTENRSRDVGKPLCLRYRRRIAFIVIHNEIHRAEDNPVEGLGNPSTDRFNA